MRTVKVSGTMWVDLHLNRKLYSDVCKSALSSQVRNDFFNDCTYARLVLHWYGSNVVGLLHELAQFKNVNCGLIPLLIVLEVYFHRYFE